jgi:hypothetical protein
MNKNEKNIKELEMDLSIKILEIGTLDKWTEKRDIIFYNKISELLEQAQHILSDRYNNKE